MFPEDSWAGSMPDSLTYINDGSLLPIRQMSIHKPVGGTGAPPSGVSGAVSCEPCGALPPYLVDSQ